MLFSNCFFWLKNILRPATLSKKRIWHRCFTVNFAKFLRTPFLQNTSGQLLLENTRLAEMSHFKQAGKLRNMQGSFPLVYQLSFCNLLISLAIFKTRIRRIGTWIRRMWRTWHTQRIQRTQWIWRIRILIHI